MIRTIFTKFNSLTNNVYKRIFSEDVTPSIEKFISNITAVGLGTVIACFFNFAFNIIAGRWLGPEEYGNYMLISTVANFLMIPMILGFQSALVKYNSEKIDFFRQRSIISTTYILVSIFTVISVLIYVIFSKELMTFFSVSEENLYFAVFLAVILVFYNLTKETLRSLHEIQKYSQLLPIQSILSILPFLFFIFIINEVTFKATLFSVVISCGVIGGISLAYVRNYVRPEFNTEWAHILQKYSLYSLLGGISSVLYQNIGKIFINMFISVVNLGIYGAYSYAFTTFIYLGTGIFSTVLFPVASMCSNKKMLFQKINKIIILIIVIGWPVTFVTGNIILKLYGDKYPFDLSLALLFATTGICISIDQIYGQFLSSEGIEGAKIVSFAAIVLALANVILNYLLIPLIGLNGAVIASIIGYLSSICIMMLYIKKTGYLL